MRRGFAAAAAVALAAVALAGCTALGPGDEPDPSPTPSTPSTPLTAVAAGDCYDAAVSAAVELIDCGSPHRFEVFASLLLEDAEYPGGALEATATARCRAAFATFVGLDFDASVLRLRLIAPSADTWEQGDREVLCVVSDPEGRTTGTLENSAR